MYRNFKVFSTYQEMANWMGTEYAKYIKQTYDVRGRYSHNLKCGENADGTFWAEVTWVRETLG